MDADLQLGPLQQAAAKQATRPDRDARYLTAECGHVGSHDLPIFVDLDVMRDMEAHARSNTAVELGGVMLGGQYIDAEGAPFIMVTDSLRARHYEATRGSFKFTADTWSQMTRDRAELSGDVQMIGWYHTHPGWGVFLSGMDLFICNHFFGRPLDVALVIDPCAGDRGWFQWSERSRKKRKVKGFFLMASRYRQSDLEQFQRLYSNPGSESRNSHHDSRSNLDGLFSDRAGFANDVSEVNDMDTRRTVFDIAIVSVLLVQLVMAGLFGWKLLELTPRQEAASVTPQRAPEAVASPRETAYAEILESVVSSQTGQSGMVEEMMNVKERERLLQANLQGQLARVEQVSLERDALQGQLESTLRRANELEQQVAGLHEKNRVQDRELQQFRDSMQVLGENLPEQGGAGELGWWQEVWRVSAFWGTPLIFLLGGLAGYLVNRYRVGRVEPGQGQSGEAVCLKEEPDRLDWNQGGQRPSLSRLKG